MVCLRKKRKESPWDWYMGNEGKLAPDEVGVVGGAR